MGGESEDCQEYDGFGRESNVERSVRGGRHRDTVRMRAGGS